MLTIHRVLFYIIGILILTFGISATIICTLGASPFDAMLVGFYKTFGLTVGTWEFLVGAFLLICNSLIERVKPDLLAMVTAFVTGVGIDFWLFVMHWIGDPTQLWMQTIILIVGMFSIGLGIACYLQSDFSPSPLDKSMIVLHEKLRIKVSTSKTILMILFLGVAYILGGPIGIGTLLMAVVSGPIIGMFFPMMKRLKQAALIKNKGLTY